MRDLGTRVFRKRGNAKRDLFENKEKNPIKNEFSCIF